MKDDILTYREMCDAENVQTLQRGMNYRLNPSYSVILMSQRTNAPYEDTILPDGMTIVYEGHDVAKTPECTNPKLVDQPLRNRIGSLTQNGKFAKAVDDYHAGAPAEKVRAYEKLFSGVWSFRGDFDLIDYAHQSIGGRHVFRFTLRLSAEDAQHGAGPMRERSRVIPTEIKKVVWERDGGKCVICGAKDELHFDHDIPFSRGGTSIRAENVKILCARHNLKKSDKIE